MECGHPNGHVPLGVMDAFANWFCVCEPIHAVLLMHVYKFKLASCDCESVQADSAWIEIPTAPVLL